MIGQTIGHYRILEKLGAGGMGEVYRAEDLTLKRHVALKVLPQEVAGSQEKLDRFRREAETLAALDHPNIVPVHEVGVEITGQIQITLVRQSRPQCSRIIQQLHTGREPAEMVGGKIQRVAQTRERHC